MEQKQSFAVPGAIIIAGLIIAGAIYLKDGGGTPAGQAAAPGLALNKIEKLSSTDHIVGNPNTATITMMEYSDLECPFCKAFHEVAKRLLEKNGDELAWVYRHFPLDSIHPKARKEAEAAECASELGGKQKFWEYIDLIFTTTASNNKLDPALLPQFATQLGLDKTAFEACLASGKYADRIEADFQNGVEIGISGTPTVIVSTKSGEKVNLFSQAGLPADLSPELKAFATDAYTFYDQEITKLRSAAQ